MSQGPASRFGQKNIFCRRCTADCSSLILSLQTLAPCQFPPTLSEIPQLQQGRLFPESCLWYYTLPLIWPPRLWQLSYTLWIQNEAGIFSCWLNSFFLHDIILGLPISWLGPFI